MQKRFQVFERIDKDGSGQLTLEDLIEGVAVLVGFKPLASV
jgi:Ca2+-binding EF-hand superfamily protein